MSVSFPFCKVLAGYAPTFHLAFTWVMMLTLYVALALAAAPECDKPSLVITWLVVCETLFMVACWATLHIRSQWLPVRFIHYICAAISVLQLAVPPFAKEINVSGDITLSYVLFMAVGCMRWFQ